MKKIGIIFFVVALIFGGIQFVRPNLQLENVYADSAIPDSVKKLLVKGCYDCHSSQTQFKWFDKITPVNFLVTRHIRDGRNALDFSRWDSLPPAAQKNLLYWAVNDVRNGAMPLGSYLFLHGEARLGEKEMQVLENYLLDISPRQSSDSVALPQPGPDSAILPEWNGLAYIPGFEKWNAISTTDRFDNGTMRVIYGNDMAIQAIKNATINPWPDGSVLAKVAWTTRTESDGLIRTGQFWQVEYMVKDSRKFASTKGWGWGRWRGGKLVPYGKDAGFARECISCHRPVAGNDFVYTFPISSASDKVNHSLTSNPLKTAFNEEAAFSSLNQLNPLGGVVINSYINPNNHSMATLYGNALANDYLTNSSAGHFPEGSWLALVTWKQQPDPRWFGGYIPGKLISVETIQFSSTPAYNYYLGPKLTPSINPRADSAIRWMIGQPRLQIPMQYSKR